MVNKAIVLRQRWLISFALILILMLSTLGYLAQRIPKAHAASVNVTLLLIHGFDDTCDYTFNETDLPPNTGPNATTTMNYLTTHGWTTANIDNIGYYDPINQPLAISRFDGSTVTSFDSVSGGQCNHNLYTFSQDPTQTDVKPCLTNVPNVGTTNESIDTIACELSWYIFDTYTAKGLPVSILAHSMGGLIVRDAMTEAGHDPTFSPQLDVRHIVTVGTPHNGLGYTYLYNAQQAYPNNVEAEQMATGSAFFTRMLAAQAPQPPGTEGPQGTAGTYWALIGADVQCVATGTSSQEGACEVDANSGTWPSGDTIVQGESAMDMNANYKVLYGVGVEISPLTTTIYSADTSTEYSHDANSCGRPFSFLFINPYRCLSYPFYLNDGSGGTVGVWLCTSNCTTNIADFIGNGNGTAPHSLANIVAQIGGTTITIPDPTATPVPPTPTPSTAWCQDVSYGTSWLTGLAAGSSIATTFTVHYSYLNNNCTVTNVQSIGFGKIYTSGTLRSDMFQCSWGGCGNEVVGVPYGPPIPFDSGWYGATIQGYQLNTVFTTNGGNTSYFCVQADGMYQQTGSSAQSFVWTPGAPGLCYPKVWPSTAQPTPITPPQTANPAPDGWIDGANGLVVSGWACDDNNGGATSQVDFYADAPNGQSGSISLGSVAANLSRPDLVTAGVCGRTPNHGYQFYAHVPQGAHTIWAYNSVDGSVKILNGSGNVTVDNYPSCYPKTCN